MNIKPSQFYFLAGAIYIAPHASPWLSLIVGAALSWVAFHKWMRNE